MIKNTFTVKAAYGEKRKTKHFCGHVPGMYREQLLDALNHSDEWYKFFETNEEAFNCLKALWHCFDIVPSSERETGAGWLYQNSAINYEKLGELTRGCTYAQLVRLMKRAYLKNTKA